MSGTRTMSIWWRLLCPVVFLASLPVRAGIVVDTQPKQPPLPMPAGSSASLSVGAQATGGGILRYQWRRNGGHIAGATNDTIRFPALTPQEGGRLDVLIAEVGTQPPRRHPARLVSKPVFLVVDANLLPFRDDLPTDGAGPVIAGASGSGAGSNFGKTIEPGEPLHAGEPGGASVWIRWRAPSNGIATFRTEGSTFDTLLAIYRSRSGDLVKTWSDLISVGDNDNDGRGFKTSTVSFNAAEGRLYFIAIDGADASVGTQGKGAIVLSWIMPPSGGIRFPGIASHPQSSGVENDLPYRLAFDFEAGSGQGSQIQWFQGARPVGGATQAVLDLPKVGRGQVGRYAAQVVVGPSPFFYTNISRPAQVQIRRRSNDQDLQVLARDRFLASRRDALQGGRVSQLGRQESRGISSPAGVTLAGEAGPQSLSAGVSGQQVFRTEGATVDSDEPAICGEAGGSSMWFSLSVAARGTLEIDTRGSDFDTVIGAFRDTGTGVDLYDGLVEIACNDDLGESSQNSHMVFQVQAGELYTIGVNGADGAEGLAVLNYKMHPPLLITAQPKGLRLALGSLLRLETLADGGGAIYYQWLRGNSPIAGATNSIYETLSLPETAGAYRCVVTTSAGELVTTETASVTVDAPPVLTAPPLSITTNTGSPVIFSAKATGTAPLNFQWLHAGTNIPGANSDTLSLVNVTTNNAGTYAIRVTNIAGSVISNGAELTLIPPIETAPRITNYSINGAGRFQIQVTIAPGGPCRIESSSDLIQWHTVLTVRADSAGRIDAELPSPVVSSHEFYRARPGP